MNYNALVAKKDGSYIPFRHDFDTHNAFLRNYMQDYDDALSSGKYQIIVGDLVVDIEDISHIQRVYEEDAEEEKTEEQGGTKGMQLYGDSFMVEGDPYEMAILVKSLQADEICMSDSCEDEADRCGECDCEENEQISVTVDMDKFKWDNSITAVVGQTLNNTWVANQETIKSSREETFILQLPVDAPLGSEYAKEIVACVQEKLGESKKVIPIPHGSTLHQSL